MRRVNMTELLAFCVFALSAPALAAEPHSAPRSRTDLTGVVRDEAGQPLEGAIVSLFARDIEGGARTALTDDAGRFEVTSLPPGDYRLRAYLAGFLPSSYVRVVVQEGVQRIGSVLVSLASLESLYGDDEEGGRSVAELRWLLQHGTRNVLKDDEKVVAVNTEAVSFDPVSETSVFEPEFAFTGEFGVRTAADDQAFKEFPGSGSGLDASVAYARLWIPANNDALWLVSAQVLESALSSWAGRAEFITGDLAGHRLTSGVTYGNYLYGDTQDFQPPEAALRYRETGQRTTEWFGSVYAQDEFMLGDATVRAGLAYEYYDYLEEPDYIAPAFEVSYPVGSGENLVVTGLMDYRVQAPGGEDIGLLSRVAYTDLFGPNPAESSLRAEKTARVQLGLEHHVTDAIRVGAKVYREQASNQLVRVYLQEGLAPGRFNVSNQGNYVTRGVGLSYAQTFGAVHGAVGYSYGKAEALPTPLMASPFRPSDEDIHDVTTTLATSIDRTRTQLYAAYRLIRHPSFEGGRPGFGAGASVDSRFNLEVVQLLPFVGWDATRWELMVAIRNLFYEDLESASMLDEIAVVDSPRRLLGGVTVRF